MLGRIAMAITAVCILGCFLIPPTIVVLHATGPLRYVYWNADGSSIGFYLYSDGTLLVRVRGYWQASESDIRYDPIICAAILNILPALWYLAHPRIRANAPWHRRFKALCAASVILLLILLDIKNSIVPFVSIAIVVIATISEKIKGRPSRAEKRLRLGLCLICGYDLRATPDRHGPRLPRCPECGTVAPSPAQTLA